MNVFKCVGTFKMSSCCLHWLMERRKKKLPANSKENMKKKIAQKQTSPCKKKITKEKLD